LSQARYRCCCWRCKRHCLLGCTLGVMAATLAGLITAYVLWRDALSNIADGAAIVPWIPLSPPLRPEHACLERGASIQVLQVTDARVTLCFRAPANVSRLNTQPGNLPTVNARVADAGAWNDTQELMPGCSYVYSAAGHAVNVTTPAAGNCGNARDVGQIAVANPGAVLSDAILACVFHLFSRACLVSQLQARLRVSVACAGCWATAALCSVEACSGPCVNSPGSPACEACGRKTCLPGVLPCMGFPTWVLDL
jgi:hypothetical protein